MTTFESRQSESSACVCIAIIIWLISQGLRRKSKDIFIYKGEFSEVASTGDGAMGSPTGHIEETSRLATTGVISSFQV